MKKILIIDIDSDRKERQVVIGYPSDMEQEQSPIEDMAFLCEAVCTLIHAAHEMNVKKDYESIKDCIEHIQKGFTDETYKAGSEKVENKE